MEEVKAVVVKFTKDRDWDQFHFPANLAKSIAIELGAMKRSQRQVANDEQISEEDMLEQVLRTYRILMNRAVKGVYIYACDNEPRTYLEKYFTQGVNYVN